MCLERKDLYSIRPWIQVRFFQPLQQGCARDASCDFEVLPDSAPYILLEQIFNFVMQLLFSYFFLCTRFWLSRHLLWCLLCLKHLPKISYFHDASDEGHFVLICMKICQISWRPCTSNTGRQHKSLNCLHWTLSSTHQWMNKTHMFCRIVYQTFYCNT
jgi:hypothetical protein